jgi:hypothetical protein
MGSIEVYDFKQQKWVPYTPDPEKWYQHFKDLSDGYVTPDHKGRYIIGSGNSRRRLKTLEAKLNEAEEKLTETENSQRPVINQYGEPRSASDRNCQIGGKTLTRYR